MQVNEFLPSIKPNRWTYQGISKETIIWFKAKYSYLVKHKNKEVTSLGKICFDSSNKEKCNSMAHKLKLIGAIETQIIH